MDWRYFRQIHLVSLAQEGYTNGLAYGNFEWMAPMRDKGWPGLGNYKFLGITLALIIITLYVVFTWFVG